MKTCKSSVVYKKVISSCYNVSAASFSRSRQMVIEEELSYQELLLQQGRPAIYQPLVDYHFLEWLSGDNTATIEKTTANMIAMYKKFHSEAVGTDEGNLPPDEGTQTYGWIVED